MATTNNMIVLMERVALMKKGVLGTTGKSIKVKDAEGNITVVQEPEPIYTFAAWNAMGYKVKKGEKHIAEINIWKMGKGKQPEGNKDANDGNPERKNVFWKRAYFFKASQVEKKVIAG